MKTRLLAVVLVTFSVSVVSASNTRYRVMIREDPATSMVVGWDQTGGSNPMVYYDVVDHGTNAAAYAYSQAVSRSASYKGMNNTFARLTGLQPNTAYYFVIQDSDGTSQRFWFKTCPDNANERLSFIAGGDSRNNATPRRNANKLVAKLKPHAVFFGGDMTNGDSSGEWLEWMNDWQLTIGSDGRMIPIVAARGNHEGSNNSIYHLFDVPSANVYYALTFGGNLIRCYTLNTEISISGNQTSWLNSDLASSSNVYWKMAQYHKPMRPHVSTKSEGNTQYNSWAMPFKNNQVKLVIECDAHTVKTTWPVVPSTDSGSDEGFVRDDVNGTVYAGEGCWGAPLRANNDSKNWTRASGQFNQFKWIFVDNNKIELRTIRIDNADQVGVVDDNDIFSAPSNLDIWNPSTGSVVTIQGTGGNLGPTVTITSPSDGSQFDEETPVVISASASDSDGTIASVDFYANEVLIGSDNTAPYAATYTIGVGRIALTAVATDNEGASNTDQISVSAGAFSQTIEKRINSSLDDVEENANGSIYTNSSDIELVADGSRGNQIIGLRFADLDIPQGATIDEAYIQFTCDETNTRATSVHIKAHNTDNAPVFQASNNNVSARSRTSASALWEPNSWNSVGAATSNERTPELKFILQELVNRNDWNAGNAMAFIIEGTGERTAEAYDGTSSSAPLLHVSFTVGEQPEPEITVFERRVTTGNDDAEEGESGAMYLNSSDLEFAYDSYRSQGNQEVGIRFTNVEIPQGAAITNAYLTFTVDEVTTDTCDLTIYAQNADHAALFTTSSGNISSREKTVSSVNWSPQAWSSVGQKFNTPDLTDVVQEVVDRSGWNVGNNMVFVLTGTGKRTAESYNGSPANAPLLHVTYESTANNFRVESKSTLGSKSTVSFINTYPNPVSGALSIQNDASGDVNIKVQNMLGVLLSENTIGASEELSLDVSSFASGTYLLFIQRGNETLVEKIMVK